MEFYNSIVNYYDYIFPLNYSKVEFIKEYQTKNSINEVLDIGCATGTLSDALGKEGFNVIGIDLEDSFISHAKQYENKNVSFITGSMLDIEDTFNQKFNIITCFGNTIVHLGNITQVEDFLRQSYSILKLEGKLLLQLVNYNNELDGLPTIENEKIKFIRKYKRLNKNKISFDTELLVKNDAILINNSVELLPVKKDELYNLLKKVGYSNIEAYSSFSKDEFTDKLNRLIIVATK